jgi:hypothetical protein
MAPIASCIRFFAEKIILLNVLSDYRLFKTPIWETCQPIAVGLRVIYSLLASNT